MYTFDLQILTNSFCTAEVERLLNLIRCKSVKTTSLNSLANKLNLEHVPSVIVNIVPQSIVFVVQGFPSIFFKCKVVPKYRSKTYTVQLFIKSHIQETITTNLGYLAHHPKIKRISKKIAITKHHKLVFSPTLRQQLVGNGNAYYNNIPYFLNPLTSG